MPKPIKPSDVAVASVWGDGSWVVMSVEADANIALYELCQGAVPYCETGGDISGFFSVASRYKRVWVWDDQATLHFLAVAARRIGKAVEVSGGPVGLTDVKWRVGKRKTIIRSLSATTKTSYREAVDCIRVNRDLADTIYLKPILMARVVQRLGLDRLDVGNWVVYTRARCCQYLRDEMSLKRVADAGTDFNDRSPVRAGIVWLDPDCEGREVEDIDVWDVSSLYPAVLAYMPLPIGYGVRSERLLDALQNPMSDPETLKDRSGLWVALVSVDGEMTWETSVDWLCRIEGDIGFHYDRVYDVLSYSTAVGLFRGFIERLYADKEKGGLFAALHKSELVSLTGSMSPRTLKYTYRVDYDEDSGYVVCVDRVEERDPGSLNLTYAFITAYGRLLLSRMLRRYEGHVVYCDTDSIHLVGIRPDDVVLDGVPGAPEEARLGQWMQQESGATIFYSGKRSYAIKRGGEAELVMAGLQRPPWQAPVPWRWLMEHDSLVTCKSVPTPDGLSLSVRPYPYYNRAVSGA
jgi:hypothetical protein